MNMRRRDFLHWSAAGASAAVVGRAWAAPWAGVRLLVVFLRGAYDAANVLIPTGNDFYYQARPTLQIARPDPSDPNAALPLDADWSLHPALAETLYPLWRKRQMAFVPFAGSDDLTRSHFETQNTMEMGRSPGTGDYSSGFMGRLSEQISGGRPIAFTAELPIAFRGRRVTPNVALDLVGKTPPNPREAELITSMYQGQPYAAAVAESFKVRDEVYREMVGEASANRNAISPKGFELVARRVARMMAANYNLAFLDIGGWDTHAGQGAATGYLALRLGELGRGLAGFADEIGPAAWNDTVVVVISEFGRTFRENGTGGTDHGHGSVYWVLGGQVAGGQVAGPQVAISEQTLNQNRDYPVLTDYRALIGDVAQRLYGLGAGQIDQVFPAAPRARLSLV